MSAPATSVQRVEVPCPLCGSTRAKPWGSENGWSAKRCADCAFVFVSPRPAPEAISEAAQLGQHAVEDGVLDVVGAFAPEKVSGFVTRLRALFPSDAPWTRRPMRWLDIGAGFGELVQAVSQLARAHGAPGEVLGLEPCRPKVAGAHALGLPVEARSLESLAGTSWDVISLINVFSHLPDPLAFLRDVRALVRPGGAIVLVTGNGSEIERADYPQDLSLPDHLVFGGEAHLRTFLERAGFTVERVDRHPTAMPRPAWEAHLEGLAARVLRRRVGYSGTPFRSLWLRARRPL